MGLFLDNEQGAIFREMNIGLFQKNEEAIFRKMNMGLFQRNEHGAISEK